MNAKVLNGMLVVLVLSLGWSLGWAQFPANPTWTTYFTLPAGGSGIEGLTGDEKGNFYVADRTSNVCNVWKINTKIAAPNSVKVGSVGDAGCRPSGITFGPDGNLYITSPSTIYKLTPDTTTPQLATVFAEGVPGANGVAFDKHGNLLVTDGTENQGRVWKIGPAGGDCTPGAEVNCEEFFRVPPRRNGTNLGGMVDPADQPDGVGSVRYTVPRHNTGAPTGDDRQDIVANGVALSVDGKNVFVGDTARGAIWLAEIKANGELKSATGCDPTLTENTLCMGSLYIAHPLLEGVDGIALLVNGTIVASVNERNAIVSISSNKQVEEVFQNAAHATTLLRNGRTDDASAPLEFPTSPFVSGKKFCTTNADSPRRDNNPNSGAGNGEGQKVNCVDQNLTVKGLALPIR